MANRTPIIFFLRQMLPLAIAGALGACAGTMGNGQLQTGQLVGGGTVQMANVQPVGGFLPNPALLAPGGPGRPDLVYRDPNVNLASYNNVLLDPVTVWADPASQLNAASPSQREALANTFYSDLYTALAKSCNMVTTASPGTMHIRFALVDAHATNAAENTVATYTPYVGAVYGVASLEFNKGVGYFAGTATAEGYGTDATKGTLLWQAVDRRGGTTSMLENTLDTWLDVHHAFEAWASQLSTRLQQLGACQG